MSDSKGVVINQPTQWEPFPQVQGSGNLKYHPNLGVLDRNTFFNCQHDRGAECCSYTESYVIKTRDQIILKGSREFGGNCCGSDYEPLIIYDAVGDFPVAEIVVNGAAMFGGRTVAVKAPPGNPVGTISRGGFVANFFDIRDATSGKVFLCQEKWRFLGGSSFPIKDAVTGIEVAHIEQNSISMYGKFTLEVTDPSVTPFQKALFLGLLVLEDTISEENRRRN